MADRAVDVLIVGAGGAGSACAEALREGGFDGSILLAGRDVDPPYERPYLSKDYLRASIGREDTYLQPGEWWAEQDVELLIRTSVMKLDPAAKTAALSTKETVAFEHAVLATGANVRRLRVDGCEVDGILYLRTLPNSDAIRAAADEAENIVIVGGSYIACEVAATLTARGRACTLVAEEALPLSRGFGDAAGEFFAGVLREHGVSWQGGDPLERFEGDGRVRRVVTASGTELDADLVVMGTGVMPDVMLARSAALELGEAGGVACSSALQASAPGVWVAGDSCEYDSVIHGRRLRVEHWEVARAQGRAVARGILGDVRDYDEVPYFWSDLSDWATLEYVGPASSWDREVLRGAHEDGSWTRFYLDGGRLVAALTVGRSDDLGLASRLLTEKTDLSGREDALADPDAEI
jgi:3-phenylpropionate/trans-cinnamate dioxygenase ferredoxin reductase subunit